LEIEQILKDLPALETSRLLIRKLRAEDAESQHEYATDQEIASLGLWLKAYESLAESQEDIAHELEGYAKGANVTWAIEYKPENKMIGRISLMPFSQRNFRAELGYAMNRNYWGKGLMTEAAQRVVDFGFQELGLNRIEAICLPENTASKRVLEKVGMKLEGIKRESTFVRGKFDDLCLYSVLKREWQAYSKS
jgi:ribosomal-protein-alanine N-acetyltransferase